MCENATHLVRDNGQSCDGKKFSEVTINDRALGLRRRLWFNISFIRIIVN